MHMHLLSTYVGEQYARRLGLQVNSLERVKNMLEKVNETISIGNSFFNFTRIADHVHYADVHANVTPERDRIPTSRIAGQKRKLLPDAGRTSKRRRKKSVPDENHKQKLSGKTIHSPKEVMSIPQFFFYWYNNISNRPVKCILEIYLVDRVLMEFLQCSHTFFCCVHVRHFFYTCHTFVGEFCSAVTLYFGISFLAGQDVKKSKCSEHLLYRISFLK